MAVRRPRRSITARRPTGLILLYFIHKHRVAGFVLLLAGGALTGLIIWAWVP